MSHHHTDKHTPISASSTAAQMRAASQSTQQAQAKGSAATPTHAQIAQCAYDIYVADGRSEGHCSHNWQMAEKQLASAGNSNTRMKL